MTSSEDVLLQVVHVRYKKNNGNLYVMNERLAWIMENKDTVSVSHRYSEMKIQKISQEGRAKIQLQVVLHDGGASTFQFTNPLGQAAQIKDRDEVKDLLQQLLPKFKRKVNKELEEKNKVLSENPTLLQLYKDLVITNVISSEEFWAQHAAMYTKDQGPKQDIGVSGAFLADIKPQTDGCNGLKYNLTPDIIESIFKTYPAVRKKHIEYVPVKITESEFWTKFFQSHYFHRDRIHAGTKDLFTECAKLDELEIKNDISAGINDPLVDISSFDDKTVNEGFGASADASVSSQTGNIVHQNMIKRFNQQSFMILKACQHSNGTPDAAPHVNGNIRPSTSTDISKAKKLRMQEKISYEDLESGNEKPVAGLNLTRIDRYLHGPTSGASSSSMDDSSTALELSSPEAISRLARAMQSPFGSSHRVTSEGQATLITPLLAINVLGELTPGGALMKGFHQDSLSQLAPPELETELKNIYLSLCDLLRHFWSCFPPTNPTLEKKATSMHEALHRFHAARIKPTEDRILREHSPLSQNLTSHLNQLLNAAFSKFAVWQQRKMQSIR